MMGLSFAWCCIAGTLTKPGTESYLENSKNEQKLEKRDREKFVSGGMPKNEQKWRNGVTNKDI